MSGIREEPVSLPVGGLGIFSGRSLFLKVSLAGRDFIGSPRDESLFKRTSRRNSGLEDQVQRDRVSLTPGLCWSQKTPSCRVTFRGVYVFLLLSYRFSFPRSPSFSLLCPQCLQVNYTQWLFEGRGRRECPGNVLGHLPHPFLWPLASAQTAWRGQLQKDHPVGHNVSDPRPLQRRPPQKGSFSFQRDLRGLSQELGD